MTRGLMLATAIGAMPAGTLAQSLPLSVGEMEVACQIISDDDSEMTPGNAVSVGACFGAMRGVVQVMQANCRSFAAGRWPAAALSVGEIPTSADAIAAFIEWAEENPSEADAPAEYGIIVALTEAFPCSTEPSGQSLPGKETNEDTAPE